MGFQQLEPEDDVNPPYGQKGGFRKITMTLPPATYERLVTESIRRRSAYEPNHLLSALLREALNNYFTSGRETERDAALKEIEERP